MMDAEIFALAQKRGAQVYYLDDLRKILDVTNQLMAMSLVTEPWRLDSVSLESAMSRS